MSHITKYIWSLFDMQHETIDLYNCSNDGNRQQHFTVCKQALYTVFQSSHLSLYPQLLFNFFPDFIDNLGH